MPLYYTGYRTELLAVDEMIWALNIYCEIQQNGSGDPQIPPFKVIESDIVWLGIYDLLLVIYSAGLARTAGKMINISRKHKFSLPAVLNSPNELLLFCNAIWAQKTNDSPTRWCKKFCGKYYHFDAIPVLDRQRRTEIIDNVGPNADVRRRQLLIHCIYTRQFSLYSNHLCHTVSCFKMLLNPIWYLD